MKALKGIAVAMMLMLGLTVIGCGGGGADVKTESYSTTLGQELKDLEDARARGIISQQEYDNAKKKLMEQRVK